jgi:SAM-dependent methyltransferase
MEPMQANIGGNFYNKYETKNPIARYLVDGFLRTFDSMIPGASALKILEIGCGEGTLAKRLSEMGHDVTAFDIEPDIIAQAISIHAGDKLHFSVGSIYDIPADSLSNYDLVICCEVFEHLPDPVAARDILYKSGAKKLMISVPREPLWRALNMVRLKYLPQLGNTPGHLNHWSRRRFIAFMQAKFRVNRVENPLPWTFVLLTRP